MSFPALIEVEGKIADRQNILKSIFDEAGPELDMKKVKSLGDSADVVAKIRELNTELDGLVKERVELVEVRKAYEASRNAPERTERIESAPSAKSFGDAFVKSAAFQTKGATAQLDLELKTLMTTTAGWAPETTRSGVVIDNAQRPIQVTDIIPMDTTDQAAYVFMEETTFTNNAAEAAEGGTYGEAALALTPQTSTVRKISVFLPVTDEQLEDVPGMPAYANRRLPFMVRQRLDGQILVGNGTAPNLRGVVNTVGIQTQAKGTDPAFDAILKAITKVRITGRAAPNATVMHPTDWQNLRLTRTTDGIYILGNPTDPRPASVWGTLPVESDALTAGTSVVGDFENYSLLAVKRGIEVQVSNSHSTFFVEGKQAIRADMRAALVFFRPAAFCTVTGL